MQDAKQREAGGVPGYAARLLIDLPSARTSLLAELIPDLGENSLQPWDIGFGEVIEFSDQHVGDLAPSTELDDLTHKSVCMLGVDSTTVDQDVREGMVADLPVGHWGCLSLVPPNSVFNSEVCRG